MVNDNAWSWVFGVVCDIIVGQRDDAAISAIGHRHCGIALVLVESVLDKDLVRVQHISLHRRKIS